MSARLGGNPSNSSFPQAYERLRRQAHTLVRRIGLNGTLQPTALLHEACVQLIRKGRHTTLPSEDLFRLATRIMKMVLVDESRRARAQKRSGIRREASTNPLATPYNAVVSQYEDRAIDLVALNKALTLLAEVDTELAYLVELRFFGGFSEHEVALVFGVCQRTIHRRWQTARNWLYREMTQGHHGKAG